MKKKHTVISFQQTITKDFIVKFKSSSFSKLIKPGQYVECCFREESDLVKPFIFSVNLLMNEFELFISAEMMSIQNCNQLPKFLRMSDPVGDFFDINLSDKKIVLLADEFGLAPIFCLADELMRQKRQPLLFLSTKKDFPFLPVPSQFVVKDLPIGMLATCPLLEDKKIPARLISDDGVAGCYDGSIHDFITELTDQNWFNENTYFYISGEKILSDKISSLSDSVQYISSNVSRAW